MASRPDGSRTGYDVKLIRRNEFGSRLRQYDATEKDERGEIFLDHAGTALCAASQMKATSDDVCSCTYGNPHSGGISSDRTLKRIQETRRMVLNHFQASEKEYAVVFVSNATAAMKTVAETFRWCSESSFVYLRESHNSLVGMREYALRRGSHVAAESWTSMNGMFPDNDVERETSEEPPVNNLVAFPAECNFSGVKYDLDMIRRVHKRSTPQHRWYVFLDAAKFVATDELDLSTYRPDFVAISFYKIFGYPTGLGALLVRRTSSKEALRRTYFGGGTVQVAPPTRVRVNDDGGDAFLVVRKDAVEDAFEDGTTNFMGIVALRHGFNFVRTKLGGMRHVRRHTFQVARRCANKLRALRHANGVSVCEIYGWRDETNQGPIVSFNVKDRENAYVGYASVERVLSRRHIQVRTGCFCNPGACATWLGLTSDDVVTQFKDGHVCGDDVDILAGRPTGAIRVSIGYETTLDDIDTLVGVIRTSFCSMDGVSSKRIDDDARTSAALRLSDIFVYPLKSCGAMRVGRWLVTESGLWSDRRWVLLDPTTTRHRVLTQKLCNRMCLIHPILRLSNDGADDNDEHLPPLVLTAPSVENASPLHVPYVSREDAVKRCEREDHVYPIKVCGKARGSACLVPDKDGRIARWLGTVLKRPAVLAFHLPRDEPSGAADQKGAKTTSPTGNVANEGSMLLVSESSVSDLSKRMRNHCSDDTKTTAAATVLEPLSFRPNLVVRGGVPFQEDEWASFELNGSVAFDVQGQCRRCRMINISQQTGDDHPLDPLAVLSLYRRRKGAVYFGKYAKLSTAHGKCMIETGMPLCPMRVSNEDE